MSSDIALNITALKQGLPQSTRLVAVTKTKPLEAIQQAYDTGHRIFGENKIQEMVSKYHELPKDIEWHMIGHIQRNKVKYMASFVHLVHAVDSLRLLEEINKQAAKHNRIIECLLQVKIASEDSKFGLSENDVEAILSSSELNAMPWVKVVGLMGMATFTNNESQLRSEFSQLSGFYQRLQPTYGFTELSMGMSGDYKLALEYGSTLVRVGSAIFGERNYQ